jgi:ubiquinone/menaquinone biosynthesis C-methylase UbiE
MMGCALEHPYQSGRFGEVGDGPLRPGGRDLTVRAMRCTGFNAGERILDIGCGDGAGSALLRRHGCHPVGLDVARDRLARAAQALPEFAAVAGDARRLPFADESFDGILAECSLSLAGYTAATLTECRRVLRPGGRLAVTDVFARQGDVGHAPLPGCLAHLARRADILAAMAAAGFAVRRWEDHSDVLKSFLAQLIFSGRGSAALWTRDGSAFSAALRASRPGYFLLIAARPEREH